MKWYYDFNGEYTDDVKEYVFLKTGERLIPNVNVFGDKTVTKNFLLSSDQKDYFSSRVSSYFTKKDSSDFDNKAELITEEKLKEIIKNLELSLDPICKCGRKSSKIDVCNCKYEQIGLCNCCESCRDEK